MYNYNYNVSYLHIDGDEGDTEYRKHLLKSFNLNEMSDDVVSIQDKIYEKFKNNNDFKNLLKKGKDFGFQIPFQLDDKWVLTMLFSYHFFQNFHYCLKDLFINDNISQENFTKISNLLS